MIELDKVKLKVLNFIRSNPGYGADQVSKILSIPLNIVHQAITELKNEGWLALTGSLKALRKN